MSTDGATCLLEAALQYAARGWHVLSLEPNGKTPLGRLVPHGLLDATTDPSTLRRWWTEEPNANVGIRTGAISGLVVLDVDPRHSGDDSLWELQRKHGTLPDTVMALTGGGGSHILFAHPGEGVVIHNGAGLGGRAGLDVRGDGGYIVAPPSLHASGHCYEWEVCSHPDDVSLAPPPAWLLELMHPVATRTERLAETSPIADGARNVTLTSLAGTMRRRGMSREAILAALLKENTRRCVPPLPQPEVERIAASIGRYDPAPAPALPRGKRSQASQLVDLADAELFHSPAKEAFATVTVGEHRETWPLKSKTFHHWLMQRFYHETGTAPSSQALQDAIGVLVGQALYDGPEHVVFTRVAEHGGAIYVDLTNERWEAVKIAPSGWEMVTNPPVKFLRTRGMAPLPYPTRGGRIDELRAFLNVAHEADFVLLVGWAIGALSPKGPYVILALHGEQGSAKSTTAQVLRALVDPSTSPLRAEPRDARDVMIAATNAWCLAFDNLSSLPSWLSDAFCRLSTGGGFATRALFTDAEEVFFDAKRPVILNGISEVATQSDLLDRIIGLDLPAIADADRRTEEHFWQAFEEARPRILGALLGAVSGALGSLPSVRLASLPRMADFARWVTAAEVALGWPANTFLEAYTANREGFHDLALEASLVAPEIRELMVATQSWDGTAKDLLKTLNERADESVRRQRAWPSSPRALSSALRRLAPNLRAVDISVEFWRDSTGTRRRMITIRKAPEANVRTVPTVQDASAADHRAARPDGLDAGMPDCSGPDEAQGDAAAVGARLPTTAPIGMPPSGLCPACSGRRFWRSFAGVINSAGCHPPALPSLVAAWLGATETASIPRQGGEPTNLSSPQDGQEPSQGDG